MKKEILKLVCAVLHISEDQIGDDFNAPLLGRVAELDSMAVVAVITMIEEQYGISVEDDEISAETFETIGTLAEFVETKLVTNG